MKLALLLLVSFLAFGQSATTSGLTAFTTAGAVIEGPASGMFSAGIAKRITASEDVFADLSFSPNTAQSPTLIALVGTTRSLPFTATIKIGKKNWAFRPYAIVAFGTTLRTAPVLASALNATTGISVTSSSAFTQNLRVGFEAR